MTAVRADAADIDDVGAATRGFLWLCVAVVGGFFAWATIGRLDVVADAAGEVIPSTQLKSVQHLEGGIVREILVREGDRVTQGQPLLRLEPIQNDADVGEISARIASLRVEIARLDAEATGAEAPAFPADVTAATPDLVRQAQELFATRRQRLQSQLAAHNQLIQQRGIEIEEMTARIAADEEGLGLLRQQVKISEDLLKDDLTNRMLHLNLLKEVATLRGRIVESKATRARTRAAKEEAGSRLDSIRHTFESEVRQDLEEKRRSLDEYTSRLRKFEDSRQRTVLRSPVDGVVKSMYVATVGGVVKAGGTVADVVPIDDKLVVEARLPTQDIGYIHEGQAATVKLMSAEAVRFTNIEGKVVQVSPDTIQRGEGPPYYKVRIEVARDYFERRELRYKLVPGVQVRVSILTGKRSVLDYLLDPFLSSFRTAFRER